MTTALQVLLGLALLAAGPDEPAPAPGEESCYLISFRGQTIGKAVRRLSRAGRGAAERLTLTLEESYRFSAGERPASQFTLRRQAVMLPDWTPVTVTEDSGEAGGAPRSVRFEAGKAVFRLPDGTEKSVAFEGPVVVELGGEALKAGGLLAVGRKLSAAVPDLARAGLVPQCAEVVGARRVEGRAGQMLLIEVRDAQGRKAWDLLVDEDGRTVESSTGDMLRTRVAREQAVLPDKPAALAAGAISLEGAPERPWRLERLTLELTLAEAGEQIVPEIAGQKATQSGRKVTVVLAARRPDGRLPREELSAEERRRCLQPETEPDWRAPEIQKAAAGIVRDTESDLKKGYLITRWVYRTLEKNLGGPPEASALVALRNRAGDCSEHAALFAALARAAGLPARTAWGLVLNEGALRFHVWSEFHAGGRWVPVDSALGRFGLPACYVTLSYDRDDGGVRLFKLYAASRARVLQAVAATDKRR